MDCVNYIWQLGEDLIRWLGGNEFGYKLWNIYVYGLIVPIVISIFYIYMLVILFRISKRENNVVAKKCGCLLMVSYIVCFVSALSIAIVCAL